jgi:4-hydroxy-tetrahydrodipicolinate synthase
MTDLTKTKLWTAIVTPFDSTGNFDLASLENLLREQEKAKNGVVLFGSTGEGLAISTPEKIEILSFVESLNLNNPLMIGVGGFQIQEQIDWMTKCQSYSCVDSFLLPVPLYAKPGVKGQIEWFRSLLDVSKYPCMLYNIPSRAGVQFHYETYQALAEHRNFWSLKEASGDLARFRTYKKLNGSIELYSGEDSLIAQFSPYGLNGLVSVMSNVWPIETHAYVNQVLQGDTSAAYPLWQEAADLTMSAPNPIPAKCILKHLGRIQSDFLRPPLSTQDFTITETVDRVCKNINQWFENNK